jgi:hypothetical protein
MSKALMWLGFILVFLIIGPFLTIWALNTLFPALAIPYSLDTWAAVILIKGLLTVQVTNK